MSTYSWKAHQINDIRKSPTLSGFRLSIYIFHVEEIVVKVLNSAIYQCQLDKKCLKRLSNHSKVISTPYCNSTHVEIRKHDTAMFAV